ncbi:frataxin-like protein [Hypoxylon trugodes]|uniref:frataxin-like protein n=1 Tax=Hypoxylon trugodes TaxID=326681 RepID=UPI002190115C|nr:frataxin-like protein [Hypoxylon trugodes]KAI1388629.1 frataxin-like protein [Hypoxylon trugodes]
MIRMRQTARPALRIGARSLRQLSIRSESTTPPPDSPTSRTRPTNGTRPIETRCPSRTSSLSVRAHSFSSASSSASSVSNALQAASISTEQYHELANKYLDVVQAKYEDMQDQDDSIDVEYSSGVMNIKIPALGTYVVNKQPPNKQIWLSSPVSGPKRFDWVLSNDGDGNERGDWIYLRDGTKLSELLKEETGVDIGETVQ